MTDYETAMAGMKSILQKRDQLLAGFTRKRYAESFRDFYMEFLPAMDAIENLYETVVEKDTMLSNMAAGLAETASGILESAPRRQKEQVNINLSFAMAAYVYPAMLKYNGASTNGLVEATSKAWKEAFPKSNVTPSDYDTIESGFHKKFCFITTACCRNKNKPDDCYELTVLRSFRDNYMMSLPDGEELINLYYDIAPSIVKHIDRLPDSQLIYDGIWNQYILPCIRMIEGGQYGECLDLYRKMVMDLKEQYFYTSGTRAASVSQTAAALA